MFSMCVVLLIFSSICTVIIGATKTVTGHRGERLDIKCPYESGYEKNSKYFCKGKCNIRNKNKVVESGSPAKDKRFSLTDNRKARVFTVTITDLRTQDAGQYWCVADGMFIDDYTEIVLIVKQDKKTTELSTISAFSTTPHNLSTTELNPQSTSITITNQHKSTESETTRTGNTAGQLDQPNTNLASVAGGLGSVLLVLILCSGTFLILKKKKRKSGTGLFQQNVQHNTENVHMYEIANSDPGPSDVIAAESSSNQTPASHLNTRPQVPAIYATVTIQQPDLNSHHTDTDCDYYANMKSPEPTQDSRTELIYATATHPQNITTHPQNVKTNEGTIYSVIKHK